MLAIISTKLSVPIWGLFIYWICSGAPNFTKLAITTLHNGSFIPVVNFPSENVPAPPSPNWIFELTFSLPVLANSSTSFILSSTLLPCSITIGFIPLLTSIKAQNNPAGPAPTIIGRISLFLFLVKSKLISLWFSTTLHLKYFFSFFTQTSTV